MDEYCYEASYKQVDYHFTASDDLQAMAIAKAWAGLSLLGGEVDQFADGSLAFIADGSDETLFITYEGEA